MKKILLKKEYVYLGNLILVNRKHPLQEKIKSYNLQPFNELYTKILLDYNANLELHKVLNEINSKNNIVPVSGYRSLDEQEELYRNSIKENGEEFTKKYVAYPNCSEHQTGLAIDLGLAQENIDYIRPSFPYTGICEAFRKKSVESGFIERYKKEKENITHISSEEWHFRYVGYPHSKIMSEMNFCLEEYIDYLRKFKLGQNTLSFKEYEINFVKMNEDIKEISIEDNEVLTISGNNVDGVIITKISNISQRKGK